jgi:adenylate cyclase
MTAPLQVRVLESDRTAFECRLTGPLEFGRQRAGEPEAYAALPGSGPTPTRLIVARQDERDNVSRRHALLEPLPSGRVRLTNSSRAPLVCPSAPGGVLAPTATVELAPPFSFALAGRSVAVGFPDSGQDAGLHSLDEPTVAPGRPGEFSSRLRCFPALGAAQVRELVAWLQSTMGVLQAAVGAADFLDRSAEALVQIVGLELGRVLVLRGDEWAVAAAHAAAPEQTQPWQPSRHLLARVREKKRTFWQSAGPEGETTPPSLGPLHVAVAAPILDPAGQVIGALYGERRRPPASPLHASGKLEALLVDVLACGVAAGMARQAQDKAALEAHVRLEQFFGPDLARRLVREPTLLEPRDAEVTVLFCDVRGLTKYSEQLGPARALRWMNDVLNELSRVVLDAGGVLVDYVGDELLAMWGAPAEQPDQAGRAVGTALQMLAALPALNERWQGVLGGPTEVGVGVNTGPAQVGNVGSKYKFKYGAQGTTVNLGSRVQGLTKYLKCRLLVTRATRDRLGDEFGARRVVRVRVVNIEEPVDLYEVEAVGSAERRQFFAEAEAALDALEAGDFHLAVQQAGALLLEHRDDGPLLLTLSRGTNALMQEGRGFDPVWAPPGK